MTLKCIMLTHYLCAANDINYNKYQTKYGSYDHMFISKTTKLASKELAAWNNCICFVLHTCITSALCVVFYAPFWSVLHSSLNYIV